MSFVVCAIVLQNGGTRGYASIFLLFVSVGLAILGIIAGIVTLALGRLGTAFEVIASAVILPTTFLLILFVIGSFRGE